MLLFPVLELSKAASFQDILRAFLQSLPKFLSFPLCLWSPAGASTTTCVTSLLRRYPL